MWCAEARSAANGEEWVRRMQTAVVSHIAQLNAWSDGTKPWSFAGYEEPVKKAMQFRVEITPYIYTAFAQYHYHGAPVIRAMCIVDGGEETDQYLLGDDLLVAPMFVGAKSRTVRLPKGVWFDYETGERVGENETIEITPALDKIPLYVRDGALIPTISSQMRAGQLAKNTPLIVRHYGEASGKTLLYDDDGETFDYENGAFAWYELTSQDGVSGKMTKRERDWPGSYGEVVWKHVG
jgi:alpha-D-xyloside xylohydrolase